MQSQSYRVLLIGEDPSQAQAYMQMLQNAEAASFEVRTETNWQSALARFALGAPDLPLPDAILWELPATCAADLATLGEATSLQCCVPFVLLVSESQKQPARQMLGVGADECLVKETLNQDLLQRTLRYSIERNRAENSVRQWEKRFEDLFDNTKDILFTMNLEGNLTSLNKTAEEVIGWPRNEVLEKNIKAFVAPEHASLCNEVMRSIVGEEPLQHFEIAVLRKDARKVLLEVSARLIRSNGNKDCIQGIARDVTERRQLENMVRQSQKLEAIGRLSGGLAHDFNNLLCVINGHTELLTEALQPGDPAIRNVTQIRKAADSAAALTRQLLAFSRRQVFHPQVVNLNAIVTETERLLTRLIDEHIEFHTALDHALGRVSVDPIQVEQVIINLVLNARDAMPKGGKLTIETCNVDLAEDQQSKLSQIPAGKYVVLALTDTGCGMNEETQCRIFEPFYTTKEMGKGTGLGLATVYGIVKQSGGFIWVSSEEGRGTTFKVYFPRVASPLTEARQGRHTESSKGTETILVVEDAEPLRALTKEFLKDSGYTVLEAANGDEAIRIAQSYPGSIDLLLTDVVMPRMGGKSLVEQTARLRPHTRVLYMSGYPNDGIVQAGFLGSGVALLEKPFTREILSKRVRQALDEAAPAT
ncbi:MAG TPA: ATP-binding protein [Candidatus Acidoferrum sp.]|nr:ATP-binding protein [Candidatus Acidoferrum sp.]